MIRLAPGPAADLALQLAEGASGELAALLGPST
jgi:hypothetical protein